jgi:hypothetical protein
MSFSSTLAAMGDGIGLCFARTPSHTREADRCFHLFLSPFNGYLGIISDPCFFFDLQLPQLCFYIAHDFSSLGISSLAA